MIKKVPALLPGVVLALGIAVITKLAEILETNAGLHLIGASVIALSLAWQSMHIGNQLRLLLLELNLLPKKS